MIYKTNQINCRRTRHLAGLAATVTMVLCVLLGVDAHASVVCVLQTKCTIVWKGKRTAHVCEIEVANESGGRTMGCVPGSTPPPIYLDVLGKTGEVNCSAAVVRFSRAGRHIKLITSNGTHVDFDVTGLQRRQTCY